MFVQSTKTKLIWTITENHLREQGPAALADLLIEHGVHAVKAIYSASIRQNLAELRKELSRKLEKSHRAPDADGLVPFLLSFVSRRALLDAGPAPMGLEEGSIVPCLITVDKDFCALNQHKGSSTETLRIAVTSPDMLTGIGPDTPLSLSFGQVELKVKDIRARSENALEITAQVLTAGHVHSGMQVSSPHISNELFPLIPEDKASLEHQFDGLADFVVINGLREDAELDTIKSAFVQGNQQHLRRSKRHPSVPISPAIREPNGAVSPRFVIKIDSEPMLKNFTALLNQVDGVYLSRAELGTLVHPHSLPITQKEVIAQCNREAKLVMVASELMHSMKDNPNPTRAEVSDMANAVSDGADALVLEHEVTEGPFPAELAQVSVETLTKSEPRVDSDWQRVEFDILTDDDSVAYGAVRTAEHVGAKAIVCLTEGGYTAARLSSIRTPVDVIAVTYNRQIMRQMSLYRAVFPVRISSATAFDRVLAETRACLTEHCGMSRGDKFVFISLTSSSISERQSNFFTIQVLE